jgi:hypothetical protein
MATDGNTTPEARIAALGLSMAWWNVHGNTRVRQEIFSLAEEVLNWADPNIPAVLILTVGSHTTSQSTPLRSVDTVILPGGKVQLHDDQQVTYSVSGTDSKGQPVTEDAGLQWSSSDETVFTVTPAPDGMSALCVAGNVGSATLQVTDGTRNATDAIDVIPGDLTAITLTAGTPEAQPPAPPAGP